MEHGRDAAGSHDYPPTRRASAALTVGQASSFGVFGFLHLRQVLIPVELEAIAAAAERVWEARLGRREVDFLRLKCMIYLEPMRRETGALRLIPGSHRLPLHENLASFRERIGRMVEGLAALKTRAERLQVASQ